MRNELTVRMSTREDAPELNIFRIKQFSDSKEFELRSSDLLNNNHGDTLVAEMCINEKKRIVSAMQLELFKNKNEFLVNYNPYYDFKELPLCYPSIYISKVATETSLRKIGLNSYLRLLTIKEIAINVGIKSLTGIVFEGASRVRLMKELGYKNIMIQQKPTGYLKPKVSCYFMWLEHKNFSDAIAILEKEVLELQTLYIISKKQIQLNQGLHE